MLLNDLHDGIFRSNLGIRIPWLITESELIQIVPETAFTRSVANWPMLRCTVLGIDLEGRPTGGEPAAPETCPLNLPNLPDTAFRPKFSIRKDFGTTPSCG
jgi:hypothetical protein